MKNVPFSTAQRWRELVNQQRVSGLSIAAFCRRHDLAPATFHFWKRRLREQQDTPAFVEVRTARERQVIVGKSTTVPDRGEFELRLRRGIRLRVYSEFDRQLLLELLDTLERRA